MLSSLQKVLGTGIQAGGFDHIYVFTPEIKIGMVFVSERTLALKGHVWHVQLMSFLMKMLSVYSILLMFIAKVSKNMSVNSCS